MTPCIEWQGARTRGGYGHRWFEGRYTTAHRAAYIAAFGPIPAALQVDHLCRNRACVNLEHLEAVTARENVRRAFDRDFCRNGLHPNIAENTETRVWGGRTVRLCSPCVRANLDRRRSHHAD